MTNDLVLLKTLLQCEWELTKASVCRMPNDDKQKAIDFECPLAIVWL